MVKKKRSLNQKVRNDLVYSTLLERKTMSVAEIQELLGVSPMTARRCLDDLQSEGLIRRMHGGASVIDLWGQESSFQRRLVYRTEVKAALARQALSYVPERGSLFLDAGTTCFEMARQLSHARGNGIVLTDSIAAALELRGNRNFKTILVGGEIADDGNSIDGALAAEFVARFSLDVLFTSASGFNDEYLENSVLAGAYIKKLLMPKALKTVCVIDSVKYCKQRCFRIFGWEDVDVLITDSGLPEQARESIQQKGVEIILVDI